LAATGTGEITSQLQFVYFDWLNIVMLLTL